MNLFEVIKALCQIKAWIRAVSLMVFGALALGAFATETGSGGTTDDVNIVQGLKMPRAFSDIAADDQRSEMLFNEMAKVITHPRCMNCHPRDDIPRQGDDMVEHNPPVVRNDASGFGAVGMRCMTCHGDENVDLVGVGGLESVPGHSPWHLAPLSMGWIGLSVGEICEQIKDPERNGGKTLEEIHKHNAEDALVGWGWHPGEGREPVPGTQAVFGDLTRAWIDSGAHCPG